MEYNDYSGTYGDNQPVIGGPGFTNVNPLLVGITLGVILWLLTRRA